ncbi:MAG: hypothetical protein EYC62_06090 [Alphaproteobacteria bacterium]|nr:MAG: hypothetical protein EYC62_06090 [Alphaproteobacteria bacterium]
MTDTVNYAEMFQGWSCVVRTAGLCEGFRDRLDATIAAMHIFPANQLPAGKDCKFIIYADPQQKILGMVFGSTDISHVGIYLGGLLGKGHEDPMGYDFIHDTASRLVCGGYYKNGIFCQASGDLGPAPKGLLELFSGALQELGIKGNFNPDLPKPQETTLIEAKIKSNVAASSDNQTALRVIPDNSKQRTAA